MQDDTKASFKKILLARRQAIVHEVEAIERELRLRPAEVKAKK